ncbi:glycerate kinase [Streptomyces sp. FH025]|uniref:glycerate kinase n=1 Tax=Streptomyces sp. FH025 TaxID=2815937 RepID=UPI001A9F3D7D|nr:glycerate kinase [Streptomyces sp. FH025]MBO1417591.1 glycerate kinase [Streptomyces sp. FH025]
MPPTPRQGHVVVAPDKFKGTLEGAEAAARIAAGIRRAAPGTEVRELPVADGGEGTLAAALAAGFTRVPAKVAGPTGLPVEAALAVSGDTAVVELAQAAGLARLPGGRTAPLAASSYGVGQLIRRAVSLGAKRIVLGLGGSACTDGGAGMVQALGVSLRDADGTELPPGGAALRRLARIDPGRLAELLTGVELVVACDVDNPLLGPRGAAAVYGPQKGADADDLMVLEEGLTRFADQVAAVTGRDVRESPGAGAAGGVGFAALALLGASMRPGIELLLELLGFDEAVHGARLVVTGEGCLDAQTLHGKAPAGVAAAAARAGVRVAAVAGRLELSESQWRAAGFTAAIALTDLAERPGDSLTRAAELAEVAGERLAEELLPG